MTSNMTNFEKRTEELKDFEFSRKEVMFPIFCYNDFYLEQT